MKIAHWALNAALLLSGLVCLWAAIKTPELGNRIGCLAAGVSFLFICYKMSVYTYKKG